MGERPVPGFPGYYAIESGDIRSTKYRTPRVLKAQVGRNGYASVCMTSASGVIKRVSVHRVVAVSFIGPCPEGMEVRHLDGDPLNNRPDNLAYGTVRENRADSEGHGTAARGQRHGMRKLSEREVYALRAEYDSSQHLVTEMAERYGIRPSQVYRIGRRRAWKSLPEKNPLERTAA